MRLLLLGFSTLLSINSTSIAASSNSEEKSSAMIKGYEAEENQQWQKAISFYLEALKKEPKRAGIWVKIAQIQIGLKNFPQAINAYKHAIAADPENPKYYKSLSELYSGLKQSKEAQEAINKAVELNPNNVDYLTARSEIAGWNKDINTALDSNQRMLILNKGDKDKSLKSLLQIAILQSQSGHYPEAINAYQQATQLSPNDPELFIALSKTYASAKRSKEALAAIDRALQLDPSNTEYLKSKASLAEWAKDNKVALEAYEEMLVLTKAGKLGVSPLYLYTRIASVQNQLHNYPEAINAYKQAIALNPKDVNLYRELSQTYAALKQPNEAINAYKQAIALNPKDVNLYRELSQTYAASKQPKEAIEAIDQAIQLEPSNLKLVETKAALAEWLRDNKLTIATYQQLLESAKKDKLKINLSAIYLKIGNLLSQEHRYEEAISNYQLALQETPTNHLIYRDLSQLYASMKEPQKAIEAIDKALAIYPNNIQYLKSKAILANWSANTALAIETYHQILKLKPNDKDALEGLSRIQHAGKVLSPFEQLLATSNNEASLHHYDLAANAMKEAISMQPNNASLYQKLSQIYATARQAIPALEAMNHAITLDPTNVGYLRAKGQIASWAGEKVQMQEAYERILELLPTDEEALFEVAHSLAWQGYIDKALRAYERLLMVHPESARGWIKYADTLTWTGNFKGTFKALEPYRKLKGETTEYLEVKARVNALVGRYQTALLINKPLSNSKPRNAYLLSTEVIALAKANEIKKAIEVLREVNRVAPDDPQVRGLNNVTLTPLRSNIFAEPFYTHASDTTKIIDIPVYGQYYITPATSLLMQALYEQATALRGSGLEPIQGAHTAYDESARIGIATQIASVNLKGLVGGLKVSRGNEHGIYYGSANLNLGERAQFTVEGLRNLYRPYLVPQSPRSISLQIMETRESAVLRWQPFVQKFLWADFSYATLSDRNHYFHWNIWPKTRIHSSEHWLVTVGVDGDFWRYKRQPGDGYYSPSRFNGYEGTIEIYYSASSNVGCTLTGGFGLQKDETFPRYYYQEDVGMEWFIGIYKDLFFKTKTGYTLRKNPDGNYHSWIAQVALTKRFPQKWL